MLTEQILEKLLQKWRTDNVMISLPYSEKVVIEKFQQIGWTPSRDVILLYSTIGGMKDSEMDLCCWSFWNVDKIVKEHLAGFNYYVDFGDFLLDSHRYYFKFENSKISSVWDDSQGGKPDKIADSVEEFFEIYLENPEKLHLFC